MRAAGAALDRALEVGETLLRARPLAAAAPRRATDRCRTPLTAPQGFEPLDIVTVKRDGRFSGEAFVVVGSTSQVQAAVDKNKSYMGRRYVEVFRAKKLVGTAPGAHR